MALNLNYSSFLHFYNPLLKDCSEWERQRRVATATNQIFFILLLLKTVFFCSMLKEGFNF